MPVFSAFVVPWVASALTSLGIPAAFAGGLSNVIVGGALSAVATKALTPKYDNPAGSYQAVINQTTGPRYRYYGRMRVGGIRNFWDVKPKGVLHQSIMVNAGEIDGFENFYVGDVRAKFDADGKVINKKLSRDGHEYVEIEWRLGKDDSPAYSRLIQDFPSKWSAKHQAKGIATIYARFNAPSAHRFAKYFPEGYNTPVTAAIRGAKVFDPRTGLTAWSDNPALCILDYLRHRDGYRLSLDDIDLPSFIDFANVCDQMVDIKGGGQEKRYRLNGGYALNDDPTDVLARMSACCDAELYETFEGKQAIRGGSWIEPTVTLTEADILSHDLTQGSDAFSAFNQLKITFTSPRHLYQPQEAPTWNDLADQDRRGIVTDDLTVDMCPASGQAQRLAKIHAAKRNPQWKGTIKTSLAGLAARGERVIRLRLPELGIDGTFMVESHGIYADLTGCELSLLSLSNAAYLWNPNNEELPEAPETPDSDGDDDSDFEEDDDTADPSITPDDYVGTDVEKLAKAFAAGISSGNPVRIDGTYQITENLAPINLTGSQSLIVTGTGTLRVSTGVTHPIEVVCPPSSPVTVALLSVTTRTFPGNPAIAATDVTQITAAGHGCAIGDWIKLFADDAIPGANHSQHRVGEMLYVADVSGDNLYVSGGLSDPYTNNIRLVKLNTLARFEWDGPRFRRDYEAGTDGCIFLTARGFYQPRIAMSCRDGTHAGLFLASCIQADVDFAGHRFPNRDASLDIPGYGVQDSASLQTRAKIRATDFRHAYTTVTNTSALNDDWWKYGRTRGAVIDGSASGCSSAAFDFHAEAEDCQIVGATASRSYLGEASTGSGFQFRGRRNRIISCISYGSQHGVQFNAPGLGGCDDCEMIDHLHTGLGDGIRLNSAVGRIRGALVRGGRLRVDNPRSVYMKNAEATIDELTIAPIGGTSGATGILMDGDATLYVRKLRIDLKDFTNTNFAAVTFGTSSTGNMLVAEDIKVINAGVKFRAFFNGGSTSGNASLSALTSDAAPTTGVTMNTGSLTSLKLDKAAAAPTTGTWVRGDIVWNSAPSAAGRAGWICVTAGTPGTWLAFADIAAA